MLGAGEDERALGLDLAQLQRQQRLLLALADKGHVLLDPLGGGRLRRDLDPHGVVEEARAQFGNRLGHGRGEEQALALLGQHRCDALQGHDEPEIHHLVGLVEHEDLDILERDRALFDQVEQTARRRDEHVGSGLQLALLLVDRHAAEHAIDRKVEIAGIDAHVLCNLRGKFARRRQDQHADAAMAAALGLLGQVMQRGQRKGCGLAGTGLGDAQQVAAFEQGRDGVALDRRGRIIALRIERTKDRIGQAKFMKIGHIYSSTRATREPRPYRAARALRGSEAAGRFRKLQENAPRELGCSGI